MKQMTLMQHFSELRRRILWCALIFVLGFVMGWYVAPYMQLWLSEPLLNVWNNGVLVYGGVSDGLMVRFSLAGLFALLIIIPVVLWHLWAFVAPGLNKKEQGLIWPVLIVSPLLFVCGAGFAFYFLFPVVFKFFVELNQSVSVPSLFLPSVRNYLSFAIGLLKVFGVAFQLPLVMVVANRIGLLPRDYVIKIRRYAIVFIVIASAVLTPPDVVSQVMLAIPLWGLFELSILFMRKN